MNLITPKDAGQRLGVSALTVIRLADSGALVAVEVAQRARRRILRFRPEAIESFIVAREQHRVPGTLDNGVRP